MGLTISSDRRSISAQEMDRNDKRLQLMAFCFICGWPQFLVWLTKDQARRGFAHHGCCAGLEEPQNGALAHDDVGGQSAPSPVAFTDCGSQTDPVSVTVPVANRDFRCGNSCVRFVNVCTQTYPFVGKVASDVNESNEEANFASIYDAVDSVTSVRVSIEQISPYDDDKDEIVPKI